MAEPAVPVEVLREAARARVEELGLRGAAAEIGLSFSGLRTFLNGTSPHPNTLKKLRRWQASSNVSAKSVELLLLLLCHLPENRRAILMREFADRVERESLEAAVKVPEWISVVRRAG